MKHILIGNDLLLRVDNILSANLSAKDKDGKDCIHIKLTDGETWTIWANLNQSRQLLKSLPKVNDQFELIENIKATVVKNRQGRESNVSREIKELLNEVR